MGQDFSGKVAIITGAASGIGNSVAAYFAERGARIIGVDLSDSITAAMADLPGDGHHGITKDLTAEGAAPQVIDEALRAAGTVDILVNSAGVVLLDSALDLSDMMWDSTISVNLSASFKMAQAAGRVMTDKGHGRIINLASQASVIGLDQHVAYCASKAGLVGMTKVLSMEWAPRGVTVNAVSPTVVETPLGKKAWAGDKGDAMKKLIPVGRFAQPEEVAALIAYLAGDEAAMITGENILIDGGYSSI
ncbi:GolD/DthD family dehydrogenase [Arthrobacter sp. VKM Ac-2550]|uniref:GolD/DthD family dehydrogenase n=1 Tax=Crystallibacter permensis TaxID=1938888 RepID=UPI0022267E7C|nr:D-threitol dehydrogenase [Arthrobacter sp. VKM Ac-2550]MCW2134510.1 2-deoxy-D-gluconate 3-dehydrogenase [Arthrobacter sp. VKM Ac-2550]